MKEKNERKLTLKQGSKSESESLWPLGLLMMKWVLKPLTIQAVLVEAPPMKIKPLKTW